jgi:hypothetical protein
VCECVRVRVRERLCVRVRESVCVCVKCVCKRDKLLHQSDYHNDPCSVHYYIKPKNKYPAKILDICTGL